MRGQSSDRTADYDGEGPGGGVISPGVRGDALFADCWLAPSTEDGPLMTETAVGAMAEPPLGLENALPLVACSCMFTKVRMKAAVSKVCFDSVRQPVAKRVCGPDCFFLRAASR